MSSVADFDDVYERCRPTLLVQLYAYCGDVERAHDALDEAFITASRHWHRVRRLPAPEPWLRTRAIRFLESRPQARRDQPLAVEIGSNAYLVRCLAGLAPVGRRLLLVRRLDDTDLSTAAREVGLTDAVAEQVLARSSSALHAAGIDTTPSGLRTALGALTEDLVDIRPTDARTLRRAGAHRRYAFTSVIAVVVVAAAAGVGSLTAQRPLAEPPGQRPTHPPPTRPTQRVPQVHVSDSQLLTSAQLAVAAGATWTDLGRPTMTPSESVYGACAMAAANPPPNDTHLREFHAPSPSGEELRQVVQLAPSDAEAHRAFRQVVNAFGQCARQHLVVFESVRGLGDESRMVSLAQPGQGGATERTLVVSRTGPVITALLATSPPGTADPLPTAGLLSAAGRSIADLCLVSHGGCAAPPFQTAAAPPPANRSDGRFLSLVDLPLVGNVLSPWTATDQTKPSGNPSATACDMTDFAAGGARTVTSRAYVIPAATRLPTVFGLTETIAQFSGAQAATALMHKVRATVAGCHKRQLSLTVLSSATFDAAGQTGAVWRIQQAASKQQRAVYRVALVRVGTRVAEVTFTPGAPAYDLGAADFVALAKRAAARLSAHG